MNQSEQNKYNHAGKKTQTDFLTIRSIATTSQILIDFQRFVLYHFSYTILGGHSLKRQVKRKQHNSKMCLVCGLKNPYGLKASFLELDTNELVAIFKPCDVHQSYPGRLHGGITTAILDETIGRAININREGIMWGVTVEFTTQFKKPIPLDVELKVVGRITKENNRFFEGTGEVLLPDGAVAAVGVGKYLKLPVEKISDFDTDEQEWKVVTSDQDPKTVEF
jgi:acyl-coenzyme A thioesterase PaaI-like protein